MFHEQLLDQQVLHKRGPFQRVRRWWRGILPHKGRVIQGLTGWETLEEADRLMPAHTFAVKDDGACR
jgi:hypothetical protein